jgi:hypothetical protein
MPKPLLININYQQAIGNLAYRKISDVALIRYRQTPYNMSIRLEVLMSFAPFLIVEQNCDTALQWANQQLTGAGLRTVRTFDLQDARTGAHDCSCPHHGTEQCDCQMVVLLVYGNDKEPETLILHGSNGRTWLSFAHTMQPVSGLANRIQKTLDTIDLPS